MELSSPASLAPAPRARDAAIASAWARPARGGADDRAVAVVGVAAAGLGLVAFFWLGATFGPDAWVPVVVVLVLGLLSAPLVAVAAGRPADRRLRRILVAALVLKLVCTFGRYGVNEVVYDGNADARSYHEAGRVLREGTGEGRWSLEGSELAAFPDETQFVGHVAGALYLVTGASQMAGYLVFAWVGWLGLLCTFRAFQVAAPDARPYLAAVLVFLLPSTLYWPSSIGKDALMVLGIGLLTLGVARLLLAERALLGAAWAAAGGLLVSAVRPHLVLIVLVGVGVAVLAGRLRGAPSRVAARLVLLALLVPALSFGLARADQVLGAPTDEGQLQIGDALATAGAQTAGGGSSFDAQPVESPLDLPVATVNVLYRPFPFEASSLPALISALEGTVLLGLTLASLRWLWRIAPAARANPLAGYCLGFVVAFVFAFSNIANAGILARQRVQMFPILMVLVALAADQRRLAVGSTAPAPLRSLDHPETPRMVSVP